MFLLNFVLFFCFFSVSVLKTFPFPVHSHSLTPHTHTHTLSCPLLKLDSRLCNRYSDTKPVNLKYAFSSSLAFGISDTTIGCNSKLVVWQDPSVVAIMPKGGIGVKLAIVRRCNQMFFTLVIVNTKRKGTKGKTMIYKT